MLSGVSPIFANGPETSMASATNGIHFKEFQRVAAVHGMHHCTIHVTLLVRLFARLLQKVACNNTFRMRGTVHVPNSAARKLLAWVFLHPQQCNPF